MKPKDLRKSGEIAMPDNSFDQSTLVTDNSITYLTPGSLGPVKGIEVRYPPATRLLVPGALAASGIMVPIVLFFVLQPPLNLIMAAATAILEFGTAAFMYFLYNSTVVRADDAGISKTQLGRTQSARWDEIESLGMTQVGNGPMQIHFTDATGKVIFRCSTLGNREDGEKLMDFIDEKLQEPT